MTDVMTTWRSPSRWQASASRSGSSAESLRPSATDAQKPQGRVQTAPRIMNVAVRRVQHSERLGHFALSQTVSRPSSPIRFRVNDIPPAAGIGRLSQSGSRRPWPRPAKSTRGRSAGLRDGTVARRKDQQARHERAFSRDWERRHGADLPANQRVVGINVVPFQAEDLFQMADQRFTNLRHRGVPLPASLHRGVPQRRFADPRLLQDVESLKIRTDIERETMVSDPAVDRDADCGDSRTREHAGQVRSDRAVEIEFLQDRQNRLV